MKFTSAVKLSEGSAMEYGREEEENFFKRLGKWRSGRRNPSKLHHTEEKDGRTLGCFPSPHLRYSLCPCPVLCFWCSHCSLPSSMPALCVCFCESLWEVPAGRDSGKWLTTFVRCLSWSCHLPWLEADASNFPQETPKCEVLDVYVGVCTSITFYSCI